MFSYLRNLPAGLVGLTISLFATTGLQAQSALEEVVVTAQKRAESLQEVPIAISAFTGEMLDKFGVNDAQD
ncbi:MAG: hypothetical protein HN764_10670, partial [Gammaproteobacteria bacterium]|nr:hypothetical protein [Gammaproteobacteria bacterium]